MKLLDVDIPNDQYKFFDNRMALQNQKVPLKWILADITRADAEIL